MDARAGAAAGQLTALPAAAEGTLVGGRPPSDGIPAECALSSRPLTANSGYDWRAVPLCLTMLRTNLM